jgi:DNA-binding NarL/FixJ family response regulator
MQGMGTGIAEPLVGRARARDAGTPAPLTAARARLLHGKALAAAGDRPAAIAALIAAESALDGFRAARWRDEAVRALRALGHRVRRPARDATPGALGPLTAREREIADLVAAGHTNREIAEQLVLSTKTIPRLGAARSTRLIFFVR